MKPNLGSHDAPPDWSEILVHFRGSELQNYFTKILEDDIKATIKPQYVDHIPRAVRGQVGKILRAKDERTEAEGFDAYQWALDKAELNHVTDRDVAVLSGGELQRFAIAAVCVQSSDVYMFDEPSSYLDVKQRLTAAYMIRTLIEGDDGALRYILVVEHDLAVLDYLSDYVCCLYGTPGAYGVVTMPFSVREGINVFLAGFIPTENLRFRDNALTFKVSERATEGDMAGVKNDVLSTFNYPSMTKTQTKGTAKFILHVENGQFTDSEIIVLLGENGTGKTTFIRMLAGILKSDEQTKCEEEGDEEGALAAGTPQLKVSYKPQKISPKFQGTVRQLLHKRIRDQYVHPQVRVRGERSDELKGRVASLRVVLPCETPLSPASTQFLTLKIPPLLQLALLVAVCQRRHEASHDGEHHRPGRPKPFRWGASAAGDHAGPRDDGERVPGR